SSGHRRDLPSFPTRRSSDLAEVGITQAGRVVVNATADQVGRYTAHNLSPGVYQIAVRFIGYLPQVRALTVPETGDAPRADFRMRSEEHTSELQSLRHLVCRL